MSVTIKYRNPRRPGEAGIVLVADPSLVAEAKKNLKKHGFVIEDDDTGYRLDPT